MAITPTPRFGMKQFSSGADPHPTRLEHNNMIGLIETNAALYDQGILTARPTAGKVGRYFWATDTKRLYADDGSAWNEVSPIGGGGAGKAVVIGGSAAEGTAERAARADHSHAIPLVTVSANGAMLAADKKKLDAATAAATAGTLALRDSAGAVSVSTPTVPAHATTKAYVDGRIQEAADYADDAVYNIPFASATEYGHMTADDKKKLDGATSASTAGALIARASNGQISMPNPTSDSHVANKGYVDSETAKRALASHSHGAGDLPVATSSGAGTMSAADKKKLDAAHASITNSTIVMRDGDGAIHTATPTIGAHATRKDYVDAEVAKKANASHSHGAGDLPVATASAPGIMSAADKARFDAATYLSTGGTLVARHTSGAVRVVTGTSSEDAASKGYVDGEVAKKANASHSHSGTDITSGTIHPDRIGNATTSVDGLMSTLDKAKLDKATHLPTNGTIAMRHPTAGTIQVVTSTGENDAANKGYVDGQIATRATASHDHSGADITSGTINSARIAKATASLDGLMAKADKTKLDKASNTSAASTLMMTDANGRYQAAAPSAAADVANKGYVDGITDPLVANHVQHFTSAPIVGPGKPTASPFKHFMGQIWLDQGAGGESPNAAYATGGDGVGGIWFGYNGLPQFNGIYGVQLINKASGDFVSSMAILDVNLTRIKFQARRLSNSNWANGYGTFVVYVDVWGW